MSTSDSPEPQLATASRDAYVAGGDLHFHNLAQSDVALSWVPRSLGVLQIDIHGSWSVADFTQLLGRLEDGYKAAAALESLTGQASSSAVSQSPQSVGISADDLLQTVTAFQLGGGLRLGSLRYGSPGFLQVIGDLNPLKTVKDSVTENREINRKRDETRRLDEREREQQADKHEEVMTRESRASEQQQQAHVIEVARLQLEAEAARFNAMKDLLDRLPADQRSVAAAQILQRLIGDTEAIANDARIDGARMLEQADSPVPAPLPSPAGPTPQTTSLGLGPSA
jgi:hypothetical protein